VPVTREGRYYGDPTPSAAILPSASRGIGTSNLAVGGSEDARRLVATLVITDRGAAGVLDVSLQESVDGTNWDTCGAFPQKNAAGSHRRAFPVTPGSSLRWAWTVAGNAITFAVSDVGGYV
jgi:hypothetical protein